MTQLRHIRIESLELDFNLHGCFQMYGKLKIKHQDIKKKYEHAILGLNVGKHDWNTILSWSHMRVYIEYTSARDHVEFCIYVSANSEPAYI